MKISQFIIRFLNFMIMIFTYNQKSPEHLNLGFDLKQNIYLPPKAPFPRAAARSEPCPTL